jgi:hypothetical protein
LKRVEPAAQEAHGVVEHGERLGLGESPLGLLVEAKNVRGATSAAVAMSAIVVA